MKADLSSLLTSVNTPGVRQMLDDGHALDALAIGKFHGAFTAATKALLDESDFRQKVETALLSGAYLQSDLLDFFVQTARYSLDCQSKHQLLSDTHAFRIEERPRINGRTWYTRTERYCGAVLGIEQPLLPLAHILLVSLATDQIADTYYSHPQQAALADFTSFMLRWNPDNTTGEVLPSVAIMFFRTLGIPGSRESMVEFAKRADQTQIQKALEAAKDFLVDGGFFSLPLRDDNHKRIKVTCPGMRFMRTHWDLQVALFEALHRDIALPQVKAYSDTIREVFRRALGNDESA